MHEQSVFVILWVKGADKEVRGRKHTAYSGYSTSIEEGERVGPMAPKDPNDPYHVRKGRAVLLAAVIIRK